MMINCADGDKVLKPGKEFMIQFYIRVKVVAKPFNNSVFICCLRAKGYRRMANVRQIQVCFRSESAVVIP